MRRELGVKVEPEGPGEHEAFHPCGDLVVDHGRQVGDSDLIASVVALSVTQGFDSCPVGISTIAPATVPTLP